MAARLQMTWRALSFPAGFEPEHVLVFCRLLTMRPLHGWFHQPDPIVCEVTATATGLRWRLGMTPREAGLLLPQLRGQLANIALEPAERDLPGLDAALELRLNTKYRALRTDVAAPVAAALLTAIRGVHRDEALVLHWLIGPWLPRPAVQHADGHGLFSATELDAEEARALRDKLTEPIFGTLARIGVHANSGPRQTQLVQRVVGALEIARAPGVAFTLRHVNPQRVVRNLGRHRGPLFDWPCVLNAAELATVLGWPVGNPYLPGTKYRGHRQLPPSPGTWVPDTTANTAPAGRYRILGRSTYPGGQAGLVHLPITDALHHLHVVGPTGTGKSVLLAHLIETDITAGRSVVVVEPKADLVAAVLARIPNDRIGDVVLLDPADTDYAVGLNVLGGPNPDLAADRFVGVARDLYRDSWGPRTSQILHAAALTLARANQSLADLPHLLSDPSYRHRLLTATPDPLGTGPFWAWFNQLSDAQLTQVIGPALNRLAAFTGRRTIRAIIGQPRPRFALADVFTQRRVLLVNLARGLIGPESARLLGALVLSGLWQAALARADTPADRRHPVALYVDEFHEYAAAGFPVDFGDVLGQARGLGIALTVAHQGLHQLDPTTRAGMSNARSRLVFQATAPDADLRHLAAALGGTITPDDIAALGAWEAYAALVHDHAATPPTSLVTLPPKPEQGTIAAAVRKQSRYQWAKPIADIEADILARRQPPADTTTVGRRKRAKP